MKINSISTLIFFMSIIIAALFASNKVNGQSNTIFDPETFDPVNLPSGMEIVNIDGEDYLRVVLNGWNSVLNISQFDLEPGMIATCDFKYAMGDETASVPYEMSEIRGVVQMMDTVNKVDDPWGPGLIPSVNTLVQDPVSGEIEWILSNFEPPMNFVHRIQFCAQEKITWGATTGDTIWIGKIEAVQYPSHTEIFKTETAPVIDGTEEAVWNNAEAIPIELNFQGQNPTVDAYWKAMWCDSGIYVLVNVIDDDHWPSWESGGNPWNYDQGEIYFDVNENLDDGRGAADGAGHYQSAPAFADGNYGVKLTNPTTSNIPGDNYAYQLNGNNWVREHFFYFNNFSDQYGFPLDKNGFLELAEIGFDISIIDQDEGVTTSGQRKVWHNFGVYNAGNWFDMDKAGTIALSEGSTNEGDSLALVALYNATGGDNWANNTNWLSGNVDTWYGVTVNNSRVTELDLGVNNLVGTIPPQIGDLTELQVLRMFDNQLSGNIPQELWNLANLIELNLLINQLTGSLPAAIANLADLESLLIQQNQFTGNIPSEIGLLVNLQELDLALNQFTGFIPEEIENLVNLQHFYVHTNKLKGNLPLLTGLNDYDWLWLSCKNNLFTFSNIEASGLLPGDISVFDYSPQDTILAIEQNGSYLTVVDGNATNNQYSWYKDEVLMTADTRTINTDGDGEYWVEVTNTDYPGLTLFSDTINYTGSTIPENNQVSSTTFTTGTTDCFNATNTITVAGDGTNVVVESGASADFIAGQSIRFLPGFHAQEGSYAHGYITETGDYCVEVAPAIVAAETTTKEAVIVDAGLTELTEREMVVYPNPNSGEFTVEFRNFEDEIRVMLFNSIGQLMQDELTTEREIRMDVPNAKSGMYFIKAVDIGKQFNRKVIVR